MLLVAAVGPDRSVGSSPPASPELESRISNVRRPCFVLVSVFMRMDSMCYYAREVVAAGGGEAVPAVDTSSWVHAPSPAGQRHFWSPGFEFLFFTQPPPSSEFQ